MSVSQASLAPEVVDQEAAPSLKYLRQRWWLLVLLFTAMLFGYAQRGALGVAAPFISRDLELSKAQMGVLLSTFFWLYAVMQLPAGWLVDRFGVKRAYSLGFVFWSLATSLIGLANGILSLGGLRLAVGAGQAIAFPATSRSVANWFQERERGTVTGIYLTGVRYGTALINVVGAFFLARYSWKLFFVLIGLIPLVWVLPWSLFLRKWETTDRSGADRPAAQGASFFRSLLLLKNRNVFGIFLGFFAYDYAWFVFLNWLPSYLLLERKFSVREMGFYSSVPFVAMSLVILVSGMMSDGLIRRGYQELKVRKLFIAVGLAVGCLIVPAGMVEDKLTAVWLLTISLCGLGIAAPNTWTLTQAVCEKKIVGTVSGIQNFGGNVGGILAPSLTGIIAQATGSFALAMGLTGIVLVVGILAYWLLVTDQVEMIDPTAPA
ncbi:MAG TPA: MFS transporter [Blastocatellia bacterium]|nr:MFS transporter [Blastocatellia bacterium]